MILEYLLEFKKKLNLILILREPDSEFQLINELNSKADISVQKIIVMRVRRIVEFRRIISIIPEEELIPYF